MRATAEALQYSPKFHLVPGGFWGITLRCDRLCGMLRFSTCSHVFCHIFLDCDGIMVYAVTMYIDTIPNRGSRPAILLREGKRQGKKIIKRTLLNLTDWPADRIQGLRWLLADRPVAPIDELFVIERSLPHGHVDAILRTIRKLGLDTLIASKPCRQRDLILALIVERLIAPCSKLASVRLWQATSLAEELHVEDADVNEAYGAMDWLLGRQERIEAKLAQRHLTEASRVLYDVSSSSYEGRTCPLAQYGHNRDGEKDLACIVYGLLTDDEGRPVAVEVYPGNTADPKTMPDQVTKLRERFGLTHVVLVGDRGMLTDVQIDALRAHPGLGWVSALRSQAIRGLVDGQCLQLSLFDERNLAEIRSPDFPGERLVACFNPVLAEERRRKREALLKATEQALERIAAEVSRRRKTPLTSDQIGLKVGRVVQRWKMRKHFEWTIGNGTFTWRRNREAIEREAALDGIYVIRTSEPAERLNSEEVVRSYKRLTQVERAFRSLKGMDLRVRPIHHRLPDRVRAHVFLCMLAYHVEWHMRRLLAPLLFEDEELPEARATRDAVKPAEVSASAKQKKAARRTTEGLEVHSFQTLLKALGTRCRNRCRLRGDGAPTTVIQITEPTPLQTRAMALLGLGPTDRSQ